MCSCCSGNSEREERGRASEWWRSGTRGSSVGTCSPQPVRRQRAITFALSHCSDNVWETNVSTRSPFFPVYSFGNEGEVHLLTKGATPTILLEQRAAVTSKAQAKLLQRTAQTKQAALLQEIQHRFADFNTQGTASQLVQKM